MTIACESAEYRCDEGLVQLDLVRGGRKTQAQDIARVMDKLNIQTADLVTHDIGNMVGYALAAQYPDRIIRWAVIDAPLPGV